MKKLFSCLVLGMLCCSANGMHTTPVDSSEDKKQTAPQNITSNDCCQDECGVEITSEVIAFTNQLLRDGSWEQARTRALPARGTSTQFVKITAHVVRYSNGSGGIPTSRITTAINDLNGHVEETGLEFFRYGEILYLDSDEYAYVEDGAEFSSLIQIDSVPGTVNIYFVPSLYACGVATMPGFSNNGIVMANNCTATSSNHSTFSHEVGHYFGLYHTHNTSSGAECVSGSNCATAGDFICDTAADPNLSGVVNDYCVYTGSAVDACGSGNSYDPPIDNLMSYAPKWCRDLFTQEQLSVFLTIAETYRADHLTDSTSGACCNESGTCVEVQEYQCLSQDWNWQGLGTICEDGCLQNALGACCAGTNGGCINNLLESMCLAGNGTWLGPFTVCEDGGCALTCDGDVDGSNTVDVNDLLAVIDQWGLTNSPSDINDDGIVDVSDLLMVVGNWGPCDEESTYGGCPDGAESDCDDCWNNGDAPSDCTQPITIGVPVCGTVSVFTNDSGNVARDMDLFSSATLNGGGNFTLSAGSSGAEMMLGIIDNYSGTLVEANILEGGFEDSFSIDGLPEGNYNIFVTTNNGDTDWSCDSGLVEYWVQLD